MNITFRCPQCGESARSELAPEAAELACPSCWRRIGLAPSARDEGRLARCLVCPSSELFVRKDFPQRLGVGLVAVGILASCIAWGYHYVLWTFGILLATALADLVLYMLVGECLMCYRCHAQYRGVDHMEQHGAFRLETHERYRQMAAREQSREPAGSP